ncbi:MAG: hypothetical protein IJL73_09455 [Lachnospiraceae bacterium]|nr:hypothetical protein [Lachnospiraceae bacterium]
MGREEAGLQPGVYTIEAAFVVSMICILVLWVLVTAFYQHDRAVLTKLGLSYVSNLLHMAEEPVSFDGMMEAERLEEQDIFRLDGYSGTVSGDEVETRFAESAENRLLMTDLKAVHVTASDSEVTVSYEAAFRFSRVEHLLDLIGSGGGMSGSFQLKRGMDPEEFVRIVRSVFGSK